MGKGVRMKSISSNGRFGSKLASLFVLVLAFSLLSIAHGSDTAFTGIPNPGLNPDGDTVRIRIYNIDDRAYAYINGKQIITVDRPRTDTGFFDVTQFMKVGVNYIEFRLYNDLRRYTYSFQVQQNNSIIFDDKCGNNAIHDGCKNPDDLTLGLVYKKTVKVTISAGCSIGLSPAGLPVATLGKPYTVQIAPSGGTAPYTFVVSGKPPGLSISANGLISGVPTTPGTFTFKVTVTDKTGCSVSQTYTLQVSSSGGTSVSVKNVSTSSGISNQNIRTTGVQWIDYNNDKRLDLFLVGSNGTALFKNIGGGKFVDVTQQANIGNHGRNARGASWADFDNDGDLDVFIANADGPPTLLLNNHAVFTDISNLLQGAGAAGTAVGSAQSGLWFDFNRDRQVDLFIVYDGAPNQLYKNTGNHFTNVASSAGLAVTSAGRSALAADFNSDGLLDLFVTNFKHPNKLYVNKGNETFQDISSSAGVAFTGGSVQAVIADYDRDTDMDLFVVNNTGSSILYKNLSNMKFSNVTPSVLKTPQKGSAAAFIDINLDGNQDLILAQTSGGNKLFENKGNGVFAAATLDLSNPANPTAISIGDFNNDGLPDIAIGDGNEDQVHGDSLYQNSGGGGNNFLTITLVGGSSTNRSAIGSTVIIQTGQTYQSRQITTGNGQSQESLPLNFGIGVASIVDTIRVIWLGGSTQIKSNVPANTKLTITQPQ